VKFFLIIIILLFINKGKFGILKFRDIKVFYSFYRLI
jgi:hypothetical protein